MAATARPIPSTVRRPPAATCGRLRPAALALLILSASLPASSALPAASADRPGGPGAPADTLAVGLPDLVVSGASAAPQRAMRTRVSGPRLDLQDPASAADLAAILPSTRVAANSRGEAHAMVRGAPERHVQIYLDGIPLAIPWDERVDLTTVPALGVGAVEGRRGPASLLDGPGAIAGSVRLLPPPAVAGSATRLDLVVGDRNLNRAAMVHRRRSGAWDLLGAGAWSFRDGWRQPGGGTRLNSDARLGSLLLRGSRRVGDAGRVNAVVTGYTAEKGVPPELHLEGDARFWRYPQRRRLLGGLSLDLPLDRAATWELGAVVAVDRASQRIDPRGPDGWDRPLEPGQPQEENRDRTVHARLRLTRWFGDRLALTALAAARSTRHHEILEVAGPGHDYRQRLLSTALVGEAQPARAWTLRAGLGWDRASTPQAGPHDPSASLERWAGELRLVHEVGGDLAAHLAAGRRSRFPTLREAYSGALGRFVVNPGLAPERQDQIEGGVTWVRGPWRLEAAAFSGRLHGGIEREAIDERLFRRVNRGRIDVDGLEVSGSWRPRAGLALHLQHGVFDARILDADGRRPAEDRPAYLTRLEGLWRPAAGGPGALLAARAVGPRWSADGTAADGRRRLPAGVLWDVRVSWRAAAEFFLRVDNVLDARLDDQTGLPAPGRTVSGGATIDL